MARSLALVGALGSGTGGSSGVDDRRFCIAPRFKRTWASSVVVIRQPATVPRHGLPAPHVWHRRALRSGAPAAKLLKLGDYQPAQGSDPRSLLRMPFVPRAPVRHTPPGLRPDEVESQEARFQGVSGMTGRGAALLPRLRFGREQALLCPPWTNLLLGRGESATRSGISGGGQGRLRR